MKRRIIIFGNGQLSAVFLREIKTKDLVIGVDGAAYWLLTHGVKPQTAVGDFDSVTRSELSVIRRKIKEVMIYPREKAATDMELALNWALKQKPGEIIIMGGVGSRFDHTAATVQLLEKALKHNIETKLRDQHNEIFLAKGERAINKSKQYKYVSLLPVTSHIKLSLTGFRYNLERKIISRGQTLGVSNEVAARVAKISIHAGLALVIRSRDH